MNLIDNTIEESLLALKEEKYKLRMYQVELTLQISSDYGVEETLQDIRSLPGVTVVTALNSAYRQASRNYTSLVRVKFHPQLDSMSAQKYLTDILLPAIKNDSIIPGTTLLRDRKPEKIQ
jgi:hypothetical protein